MAWLYLFLAGLLEIGWAVGLKYTDGFTRPVPSVLTGITYLASVGMLGLALKTLPLGSAYAIWTGIGIIGTSLFGALVLNEPVTAVRVGCVLMIVAGIAGLKLTATA